MNNIVSNSTFGQTIYNGVSDLVSSGVDHAGRAIKWSISTSYSTPYQIFKFGVELTSSGIRHVASPVIDLSGDIVNYLEDKNLVAAAGYGYVGYQGYQMMKTPFTSKAKWFRVDDRFKSKIEIKPSVFNFGDAVKKIEPIPQVISVTEIVAAQFKKKADNLKDVADAAELTKNNAQQQLITALLNPWNPNTPALQQTFDTANQAYIDAKKAADEAKAQADKATGLAESKKKDDKAPATAESGSTITLKAEKTKKKAGETWINLPMSEQAIVINWDDMKKEFTQLSAGFPLFTAGAVGLCHNIAPATTEFFVGPLLSKVSIPGQVLGYLTAKTFAWVASNDTLGFNKLATAGALATGAYFTIKGFNFKILDNKVGIDPVSGVWFKYKKGSLIETKVERTGSITKDLLKVALATCLVGASILSIDDFLSGQ